MEVLALIPARAGSKGVTGKNLRRLAGKPLVAHTIEAAVQSRWVTRVVLSTDSEEIAEIGRNWGAEVPFLRPAALAADETPMFDVIRHALQMLGREGYRPDRLVLLQPTSPLRRAVHIDEALSRFEETVARGLAADSLASVCPVEHSPYWMRTVEEGFLQPLLHAPEYTRRQDLPDVYRLNGAIYVTTPNVVEGGQILGNRILPYVMRPEESVDIDIELDFAFAEFLLERRESAVE